MTFDLLHDLPDYAPEQMSADAVFTRTTQDVLLASLGDIEGLRRPAAPVALWLKHALGNTWYDSCSRLVTVLSHHGPWIDRTRMEDLDPVSRAQVSEVLATFFQQEHLFRMVYGDVGFESHEVIESVHFASFSMFWISGSFDDLEEHWEGKDRREDFEIPHHALLKICARSTADEKDACLQRMEIRRGLHLVQGFGVLGQGDFVL